jgi:DNA-directed RNA polymerase I subunit RPA12
VEEVISRPFVDANTLSNTDYTSLHDTTLHDTILKKQYTVPIQIIIMTWPFCPSCRATLAVDSSGTIQCGLCPYSSSLSEMKDIPTTTTFSSERAVPMWAKSDSEQKSMKRSNVPTRMTIEEPCIKCSHPEVGYYTVQLRSVDEGQTVFYECPNCNHTWSLNN